jgi:hypothetical protein
VPVAAAAGQPAQRQPSTARAALVASRRSR